MPCPPPVLLKMKRKLPEVTRCLASSAGHGSDATLLATGSASLELYLDPDDDESEELGSI